MQKFQHYIDGAFSDGAAQFESHDPATGQVWALMPEARMGDVNRAVEAAERAFHAPEWADLTATARGKLLMRLADLISENAQTLAKLETRDTGKINPRDIGPDCLCRRLLPLLCRAGRQDRRRAFADRQA